VRVIRLRRDNRVGFGDGENSTLRAAIRAHAHFAEYVPVICLMLSGLEMLGTPAFALHALLGMLVIGRLLHPFGLNAAPGTARFLLGRVLGMTLTLFVLVAAALMILRRTFIA
jgi:uncharacterized membrane protein YecN with MAPEG domain